DELEAAARALVVEQDARAGEQVVALAIVDRDVVSVDLRHAVRASRMERGGLALRGLAHLAEHLARARLVEARLGCGEPCGLQEAGDTDGVELGGQDRRVAR